MPYGSVRDAWDCERCLDEGTVTVDCVNCDGTGEIIISRDGDKGVCGECGGDATVTVPCNHSPDNEPPIDNDPVTTAGFYQHVANDENTTDAVVVETEEEMM